MIKLDSIKELKILDLGLGMAAALISKFMAEAGAKVWRIEPPQGDPFYEFYPAYRIWREGCTVVGAERQEDLLRQADVCLLGGEDFPGLRWTHDANEMAARNPRLVVVELSGYIDTPNATRQPAVDLLVQASSGIVFQQYGTRPHHLAFPAPTYGAVLSGLLGLWAALIYRARTGLGQVVRTSLQQGAALWIAASWMIVERPDAAFDAAIVPKGVRPLIFPCADGKFVHLVPGTPGSLAKLYRVLGIDQYVDPADRGAPSAARGPKNMFNEDTDRLGRHVAKFKRKDLLDALWREGLAAEAVLEPGECWAEPQVVHNGIIAQSSDGTRCVANPVDAHSVEPDSPASVSGRLPPLAREDSPLRGLRVVDLGAIIAGPYASRLLADLGADVIKVEPPSGDPGRFDYRAFAVVQVGKRGMVVDAKAPDGLDIIRRLCAQANVVQHNFRPGVAERLGLDPSSLRKVNSPLVTLETSGYGSTGPKAQNSGFDPIMQALCGHEVRAGGEHNVPLWYSTVFVDYATGALGGIALLMGVYEQLTRGHSVEMRTSLLNSGIFLLSEVIQRPDGSFAGAPSTNKVQTGFHPAESLYQTSDGWVAVAARSAGMAAQLAQLLGLDGQIGSRSSWGEVEARLIAERLHTWSSARLLAALEEAGVWASACESNGWRTLRRDPTAHAAGLVTRVQDRHYGTVDCLGVYFGLSRLNQSEELRPPPPAIGEHTSEILRELGYTAAEVEDLYQRGIVA